MTELEMIHGVFNHLEKEGYSFFYLRDAGYSDYNPDVWEQTEEDREKLQQLKNRIRQKAKQHHLCAQEYTHLKHLEEFLLADLPTMVNTLFCSMSR